jgi:transcriptional regulator GlxA family with amidase domain
VITSGAATSFLDLALHLIELYNGHQAAVLVAKAFLIEMGRRTQLPYTMFSVHSMHNDQPIRWVQQFIQQNLGDRLTTKMMSQRLAISVRTFDRRFRNAVGEAPSLYVQRLRVEKAKRLLETTGDSIEEITVRVGYKDERSFRRLFRRLTDLSPRAYRLKYGLNRPVQCLEIPFLPANISAAK